MRNGCDSDSRCGLACDASTRDAKSLAMWVERCEPLRTSFWFSTFSVIWPQIYSVLWLRTSRLVGVFQSLNSVKCAPGVSSRPCAHSTYTCLWYSCQGRSKCFLTLYLVIVYVAERAWLILSMEQGRHPGHVLEDEDIWSMKKSRQTWWKGGKNGMYFQTLWSMWLVLVRHDLLFNGSLAPITQILSVCVLLYCVCFLSLCCIHMDMLCLFVLVVLHSQPGSLRMIGSFCLFVCCMCLLCAWLGVY